MLSFFYSTLQTSDNLFSGRNKYKILAIAGFISFTVGNKDIRTTSTEL